MYFQKTYREADWATGNVTLPYVINWRGGQSALRIDVTGTINYDLQQTFDDIQNKTPPFVWAVDDSTTQAAQTTGQSILFRAHPRAVRFLVNSFTTGATITLSYTQRDY